MRQDISIKEIIVGLEEHVGLQDHRNLQEQPDHREELPEENIDEIRGRQWQEDLDLEHLLCVVGDKIK
jgi:hypothetical protein